MRRRKFKKAIARVEYVENNVFLEKLKSASRRLVLGTSATNYEADDYKVRVLCIPVSSYWFTMIVGILRAVQLFYQSIFLNKQDYMFLITLRASSVMFTDIVEFILIIFILLVIGLIFKCPGLILPYQILCALCRIVYLLIVGILVIAIFVPSVIDYIGDLWGVFDIFGMKRHIKRHLLMHLILISGSYYVDGLNAEAATKCVAQMNADKKKTAID